MLVADGRLRETDDGATSRSASSASWPCPETLQALIAARLDGLPAADRAILQDAAVLGQSFTLAGLAAVTGQAPEAIEPRLRVLVDMELLDQKVDPRSPERGQYAFVQALIREVAYATLAKRDRRSRHLAAARFFESLGEDELAGALAAPLRRRLRGRAGRARGRRRSRSRRGSRWSVPPIAPPRSAHRSRRSRS